MSFRTDQPLLQKVLEDIGRGDIQLPDFQRGWVWDDPHIRSLIASISLDYPIGAVMFLDAGGVPFKPRLFEGVRLIKPPAPRTLVLDGQQRLTSMYLALKSGQPVKTTTEKSAVIGRVYFLDMAKCLDSDADREEAVVSIPATLQVTSDFGRKIDLDLTTLERQFEKRIFPVALLYDEPALMKWRMAFTEYHGKQRESYEFMMRFEAEVVQAFRQYRVPAIELTKDTPREAVCQVFEKVNMGGVTLTVFELVTATFAADEFELRPDWEKRKKRMVEKRPVLQGVAGSDFLTAVTLLSSYRRSLANPKEVKPVSCKKADVLRLPLAKYKTLADAIEEGFRRAAELLAEQKIFDTKSLPYATQLIPLSAICATLGDRVTQQPVKQKVLHWYWCGVFGELYGGANETRFGLDLPQVVAWIDRDVRPRTVKDASFAPTRLLTLQSRLSAAYKGIAALLMQEGSRDWLTGTEVELTNYFDRAIDIHHIFPRAYCEQQRYPRDKWNSVVNKAPLAAGTNRYIGGDRPSLYLARIEKKMKIATTKLDGFLITHCIESALVRSDDFDGFFRDRACRLLDLIERATGKTVAGRDSQEVVQAFGAALVTPSRKAPVTVKRRPM